MDKNRKILIGLSIAAFVVFIAYIMITTPRLNLLDDVRTDKLISMKNMRVVGWDGGKKSFELIAGKGWTNRDQSKSEIEDITDGTVYKDKEIVMKELKAKTAKVESYKHETEIFGGTKESEAITVLVDMKGAMSEESLSKPKKRTFTRVRSSYLKYNSDTKKTEAESIEAIDKKFTLISGRSILDHDKKSALFWIYPKLTSGTYLIYGQTIEVFFKEDKAKVTGEAKFLIFEKKKKTTDISCNTIDFSIEDHNAQMHDKVKVVQKGKTAFSDQLSYVDKTKTATLFGRVKAFFKKGGDLIKEERLVKLRSKEAKEAAKEATVLTCSSLDISTKTGDAAASGNVEVFQNKKQAKADHAIYDDNKEIITLTGNVFIKKTDEWIKTKKLIVSLKKETFEAFGSVETMFKMKK